LTPTRRSAFAPSWSRRGPSLPRRVARPVESVMA
jgi:hypothetical protein